MSKEFDNKNRVVFFPNNKKTPQSPNLPDYTGTINIDGKDWEISIWNNVSAKGVQYFSGSVKEPFKKGQSFNKPENTSNYKPVAPKFEQKDDYDGLPF